MKDIYFYHITTLRSFKGAVSHMAKRRTKKKKINLNESNDTSGQSNIMGKTFFDFFSQSIQNI